VAGSTEIAGEGRAAKDADILTTKNSRRRLFVFVCALACDELPD
jgi:hypothetical protein